MAYYYRPHYGGFHGFGRRWNWGGRGLGRGWGQHGLGPRHGLGRRWPWLHADVDQSAMLPWAQTCLAQLFGPSALQNVQQAIQQFQSQQQLPVTGMLDANTLGALQAACSAQQAGGQDAGGQGAQAPQVGSGEIGESEEYDVPPSRGTVIPGRQDWPFPFNPWGPGDEEVLRQERANGASNENKITDAVFYARHPEWKGRKLRRERGDIDIENLKKEWTYLKGQVLSRTIVPSQFELDPFYDGHEPGMHRYSGRWVRHKDKIVVHL
jgi:hypothetical protein